MGAAKLDNKRFYMYKKILITLIFPFVCLSCTSEQSKTSKDETVHNNEQLILSIKDEEPNETRFAEKPKLNKVERKTNEQLTLVADKKNKLTKFLKDRGHTSSISLNSEKFTLHSTKFSKGAKVYNIQMREYGLVKGTIVVVSIDKVSAAELLYPSVKVLQIAKNTFRLTLEKSVELMPFYKSLIKSNRFSVVEMEVDYSPFKELAEY